MSEKKDDIINSLVLGGIIGAVLGGMISKSKGTGVTLGAIAGAALLASVKANENAQNTEIPLVIEENDALYEVYTDGTKKFIKNLPSSNKTLPKKFTLK